MSPGKEKMSHYFFWGQVAYVLTYLLISGVQEYVYSDFCDPTRRWAMLGNQLFVFGRMISRYATYRTLGISPRIDLSNWMAGTSGGLILWAFITS